MNVRSIKNKITDLHAFLSFNNFQIILMTETWLSADILSSVITAGTDYKMLRRDRANDVGYGGVAALISSNIDFAHVELPSTFDSLELLCFDVFGPYMKYRVILWYRPPDCGIQSLKLFCGAYDLLSKTDASIILVGDFNFPHVDWSQCVSLGNESHDVFVEFVNKSALCQHVLQSTRNQNILDLVFSNDPFAVTECVVREPFSTSDHNIVAFSLYFCSVIYAGADDTSWFDYSRADWDSLNAYISETDWQSVYSNCQDSEQVWSAFSDVLQSGINMFVPVNIHKVRKKNVRSYPAAIRKLYVKKKRLWCLYKRFNNSRTLEAFKRCSKEFRNAVYRYHCQLESTLISSNNLGKFYRYVNKKLVCNDGIGPLKDKDGSVVHDPTTKANLFADYFSSVFTSDNGINPDMQSRVGSGIHISNIYFTVDNVYKCILKLKPHSSPGPDQYPPNLFRNIAKSISGPLAVVFECLFVNRHVPSDWRLAAVTPIHKKSARTDPANYRPISLTNVCCKLMESIVKQQLLFYLMEHKLISKQQFGFISRHSTCSQLMDCLNEWTLILENGSAVDCVYIDYSKAFDSVVHSKLLTKLSAYGIDGDLYFWIKCFLTDRVQYVVVNGCYSEVHAVVSGVPQGSVLGPILFILYINDIVDVIETDCHCKLYADDVKLFAEFGLSKSALAQSLLNVVNWSATWQLTINVVKCNAFSVGTKPDFVYPVYFINGVEIPRVDIIADLGVTIDSQLKFSPYVVAITNKAFARSDLIFRSFFTRDPAILIRAFITYVRPLVEYCTPVWYPHSAKDIRLIESVQRRFTKRIPTLEDLSYADRLKLMSLDSLELRRLRFDLRMVYKIMNGLIDLPANDFFTCSPCTSTRRADFKLFKPLCVHSARFNFFSVRIINCWNRLPTNVKCASSYNSFCNLINKIDFNQFLSGYIK